ncbi:CPBP family intramembrane glutamic endopeptidase [Brevundimonas sp. 'scallop']|uniref:CPBP family intramembrane glutamic endopeptidase n=1 Tax=Brevundimonas sp. 'scallop' TaxID=2562582 RepID=UPI0013E18D93|nr:CPBP family intramembrane glutamic endopeptidase [Brevundimonas sp. 'scallop']QIF80564.1 CPBP family intramembrane metalloprotease [Brevundimonas sp. 'scallop']
MTAQAMPRSRTQTVGLLAATAASPLLVYACDRGLLHLIAPMGQPWIDMALARPASFVVCGLLFLGLVQEQAARLPWPQSLRLAIIVGLVFALASAVGVAGGAFSPTLPGSALIGFLLLGLMAEEWLFRGVVFEAFRRLAPWGDRGAVIGSALLFAVSHLGYHSFQPTPAALQQVAYTLPLGLALGWLRLRTGRIILPGALAHLMFNLAGLLATAALR